MKVALFRHFQVMKTFAGPLVSVECALSSLDCADNGFDLIVAS